MVYSRMTAPRERQNTSGFYRRLFQQISQGFERVLLKEGVRGVTSVTVTWLREDCAGASPAALICSADPRQGWKDFPPKPSYPPAEQKSPPILTRSYCRDALHSETKDSSERGEEKRREERRRERAQRKREEWKEKEAKRKEKKEVRRGEHQERRGERGGKGKRTGNKRIREERKGVETEEERTGVLRK